MMGTRRDTSKHSKATFACVGLLVVMIVLYLYFLNMSVAQVVMRTEYVQQKHNLSTEIAMLEASYIEAQHKIASGIVAFEQHDERKAKIFVSREQASLVLGNN